MENKNNKDSNENKNNEILIERIGLDENRIVALKKKVFREKKKTNISIKILDEGQKAGND